jgi:hypothetical protein
MGVGRVEAKICRGLGVATSLYLRDATQPSTGIGWEGRRCASAVRARMESGISDSTRPQPPRTSFARSLINLSS